MRQRAEGRPLPDHAETRLEQRLIEGSAVVSDQHFELLQVLGERAQQAGLFAEVAHKELPHAETLRRNASHADQKRIGARSSRQASGFGIQEAPFRGRDVADFAVGNGIQQIVRKILEIRDADAAMAPVAFVELFGFVVAAVRGFELLAVQPIFGGWDWGLGLGGWRRGRGRAYFLSILAMRRRRCGELFLEVAHACCDSTAGILLPIPPGVRSVPRGSSPAASRRAWLSSALTKFARLCFVARDFGFHVRDLLLQSLAAILHFFQLDGIQALASVVAWGWGLGTGQCMTVVGKVRSICLPSLRHR